MFSPVSLYGNDLRGKDWIIADLVGFAAHRHRQCKLNVIPFSPFRASAPPPSSPASNAKCVQVRGCPRRPSAAPASTMGLTISSTWRICEPRSMKSPRKITLRSRSGCRSHGTSGSRERPAVAPIRRRARECLRSGRTWFTRSLFRPYPKDRELHRFDRHLDLVRRIRAQDPLLDVLGHRAPAASRRRQRLLRRSKSPSPSCSFGRGTFPSARITTHVSSRSAVILLARYSGNRQPA